MRRDKEKIFELRAQGKTYNEICAFFPISKGTLSCWFGKNKAFPEVLMKNEEESKKVNMEKVKAMNKGRSESLVRLYEKAKTEAREEFAVLKANPLFFTALALYWGEGDKRSKYNIRITNTDPKLIKIFIAFSVQVLGIPKERIKAWLLIYPDLNDNICKVYWSEYLSLSSENFNKTIIIEGKRKVNRLNYGVCTAGFSSIYAKKKLLVWLEMLGDEVF